VTIPGVSFAIATKPQTNDRVTKDYSVRYSDNWGEVSYQAKVLTKFRCSYPGCSCKCVETHHAIYSDKQGMIAGREIPGVHVFPLCDRHHKLAHSRKNWIRSMNPVSGNRNTSAFYLLLLQGWRLVTQ
jgi:hypothetical protein